MDDQQTTSLSIIKRAAMLRQQHIVAEDAVEREQAKWQNRLKRAVYLTMFCGAFTALSLIILGFPWLYPRDLEGLGILLGASAVFAVFFLVSYFTQEWVDARIEQYWFWRSVSVMLFLAVGCGMLYAMFATAEYWLVHFR